MTEIQVELPVKINGVFITNNVRNILVQFQSACSPNMENGTEYSNEGIADVEHDINELNNYFIEIIAMAGTDETNEREKNMLTNLYWIRDKIIALKVPPEFIGK